MRRTRRAIDASREASRLIIRATAWLSEALMGRITARSC
jgi:hypothetical protein